MPDPQAAARDTLAEQRSQQLLAAAARLMERNGSQGVAMQAVAAEAGVSVGLIYRYFGGKDDLVLAVITGVLDDFARHVPASIAAGGDDPVDRLAAAFRGYCEVIDRQRHATVLTYRESKALDDAGREEIKRREVETIAPLRQVLSDGVAAGVLRPVDVDLVAYDLLLYAHAWALKHWHFERLGLDDYVGQQFSLMLSGILEPRMRRRYARHLD